MSSRLLLFTSGLPQGGTTTPSNVEAIGQLLAEEEVGVSLFGVGADFENTIPRALIEHNGGNYTVTSGETDLLEALRGEAESGYWPVAKDLTISVRPGKGYRLGQVFGAQNVVREGDGVRMTSPTLFLGARQGSSDTATGRRGGGGGWFVEALADTADGEAEPADAPVLNVTVEYHDMITERDVTQTFVLETPLGVGNNPEPEEPFFSPELGAKPFMMLNMFLALRATVSYYEQGACNLALGMQDMMSMSYFLWDQRYDDVDITDDFDLLVELSSNLYATCRDPVALWPVDAEVSCFYM